MLRPNWIQKKFDFGLENYVPMNGRNFGPSWSGDLL